MTDWLAVLAGMVAGATLAAAFYLQVVRPLFSYWWHHRDQRESAEFADWYVATHDRPHDAE